MGALSFAAGTLASISSAFAPRIEPAVRPSFSDLVVELDNSARRILDEFSTGMSMLYKHGSRNPCNVSVIANQNLKLLLKNLKANASFSNSLAEMKNIVTNNNQWARLPLLSSRHISASMLYLPAGTSVPPTVTNVASHRQSINQDESLETFSGSSLDQSRRQHYLALIGLSEICISNDSSRSKILLKAGDAYSQTCIPTNIQSVSSLQGPSLVLNIQLPTA